MSVALYDNALSDDSLEKEFANALAPNQLMSSLFDSIPGVYFFVKNLESRFVGGSESFARMLGAETIKSVIGKTDYDFSPDFLADGFCTDDQSVIASGKPIHNKIELVPNEHGSLDWLCTTKIPLFDKSDKVCGVAGVARLIEDTDAVYADRTEMRLIVEYARERYREKISVADMAKVGGISVSTQERLFKKTFGLTPLTYLQKIRLNAACKLLRGTDTSLSEIATQCGFSDQTNMTRAFRLELKITPYRYRNRFSGDGKSNKPRSRSWDAAKVL
ncbi:AraC family transcriptional regulator [Puniceicoccaceae bacterium K14]|nr:AraC family transcriptional regulator [Puniceicoccaceae bacterium K14]